MYQKFQDLTLGYLENSLEIALKAEPEEDSGSNENGEDTKPEENPPQESEKIKNLKQINMQYNSNMKLAY